MESIPRFLDLNKLLKSKSFFIFGPRSTGKTTLIKQQLADVTYYDLLDQRIFARLLKRPETIEEEQLGRKPKTKAIVIDEIQKLPHILDEVHRLIEAHQWRFVLTGSSARKLKRGGANLLAGRAWMVELFPLTFQEIPQFDLIKYLNCGGLPQVYYSTFPEEELESYVSLYLKEEIQAESLTRNLPAFARFLDSIALSNGEEINLEGFASDCGVSPGSVKNYLQILEDTLIGFSLPAFRKTKKRKAISRSKHYLFDVGVVNQLCQRGKIFAKTELFGKVFEQFLIQEIRAYLSYTRQRLKMSYWRSLSQFEVDLIIGNVWAIEIKASDQVQERQLKGLRAFKEEGLVQHYAVISCDPEPRETRDGIKIFPWKHFLTLMWNGSLEF